MSISTIGTTAKTGETCPELGIWKVVGNPSTTVPISKGNTFPPYNDKAVTSFKQSCSHYVFSTTKSLVY